MTDNDIIKALECCNRPANQTSCDDCPYQFSDEKCSSKLIDDTLDLINRQQAGIERWSALAEEQSVYWKKHFESVYESAKETVIAEAIKEFAERLKELMKYETVIYDCHIDNLVKEMTEGKQ